MSNPINDWIDARIKTAVADAILDLHNEITGDLAAMENNLTAQITSLPGLLAGQIENVAVDAGSVASKVIAGITGQFTTLPQQIIAGVLQGIPNILNPFKGPHDGGLER